VVWRCALGDATASGNEAPRSARPFRRHRWRFRARFGRSPNAQRRDRSRKAAAACAARTALQTARCQRPYPNRCPARSPWFHTETSARGAVAVPALRAGRRRQNRARGDRKGNTPTALCARRLCRACWAGRAQAASPGMACFAGISSVGRQRRRCPCRSRRAGRALRPPAAPSVSRR